MSEFALVMATGMATAVAGLELLLVPVGVAHARVLRLFGLVSVLLGAGTMARGACAALESSALFRMFYVAWSIGASVTPVIASVLTRGRGLAVAVLAPVVAGGLALFAWTPAFLSGPATKVEVGEMGLRWAFLGSATVTALAPAFAAGRLSAFLATGGDASERVLAWGTVISSLVLAAVAVAVSLADAGFVSVGLIEPVTLVVPGTVCVFGVVFLRHALAGQVRTIGQLHQDLDREQTSSLRDALTGLYNRAYFAESLHQALEQLRRTGEPFAVCMIDLDDFKKVNDTHGHQAGDLVLQNTARTVMRTVRPYDMAARYGGEELVVILRNVSSEQALVIAERIRKAVAAQSIASGEARLSVTVSIGVVAVGPQCDKAEEIVRRADEALYRAKRGGKNQVVAG